MNENNKMRYKIYFIVGDFNLPVINWELQGYNNVIEMEFLDVLNGNFLIDVH